MKKISRMDNCAGTKKADHARKVTKHEADPRGLIFEAYHIDGIASEDCRAIFFDWALGTNDDADLPTLALNLLTHYAPIFPNHPMTAVLSECQRKPSGPRWSRRRRQRSKRET